MRCAQPSDWLAEHHAFAEWVVLSIFNTNMQCGESAFSDPIKTTGETDFRYSDWKQDGTSTWGVGVWTNYMAGTGGDPNYDCPDFYVQLTADSVAEAITKVHYNEADMSIGHAAKPPRR